LDPLFFGISSAEVPRFTQHPTFNGDRFEALENANILISKIKGSNMGVFVAAGMDEGYIKLLFAVRVGEVCDYLSGFLLTSSDVFS
jgi:acyl transferase domain-containing protein